MRGIPTNFATAAITAASLLSHQASAQLPRECFFATEMHTLSDEPNPEALLISDLPRLVQYYKPGMRLGSITAIQDEDWNDHLVALQTTLWNPFGKELKLEMIGDDSESY